ncbi:MAG: hypothetical protein GXP29_04365, partial [Planctomycetes bacterium]|nr:hypothetical protein [Planctomycetota bacterium]
MNTSSQPAHRDSAKPQSLRIIVAFAGIVVAFVTLKAPHVFLIWALDGMVAAVTLFAATCTGFGFLRLLQLGDMPRRWQILLAAGMGIGCLSLVVLACGLLGWIGEAHRYIAPGILLATGAAGWLGRAPFSKSDDGQK